MNFLPSPELARPKSDFENMPRTYEELKQKQGARKLLADWTSTKVEETNLKLVSYIDRRHGLRILEIGAGRGYFCKRFNEEYPNNAYFVLEYEEANLDYGFRLGFFQSASLALLGSIFSLPFESQSFDLIIVSEVLEHLRDLNLALSEVSRVLKTEGWVIASVPNSIMYLYPLPILVSLIQSIHHRDDNKKGFQLLVRRLKRMADDNNEGRYHRPFLPQQFRSLFEKCGYEIIKHRSSILYYYYPPFSTTIDSHPNSPVIRLITKLAIKLSDQLLQRDLPFVKYLGIRQHILSRRST